MLTASMNTQQNIVSKWQWKQITRERNQSTSVHASSIETRKPKIYDNSFRKLLPLISMARNCVFSCFFYECLKQYTSGKNSDLAFKLTGYCKTFVVVGP